MILTPQHAAEIFDLLQDCGINPWNVTVCACGWVRFDSNGLSGQEAEHAREQLVYYLQHRGPHKTTGTA